MKYIAILVVAFFSIGKNNPVKNGTYQSVSPSFQENFFLLVEGDKIHLYGWELNERIDTIYYRSASRFENGQVKFHEFEFSRLPINRKILGTFSPDKDLKFNPLMLHTRLFAIKQVDDQLFLSATKDIYDSRADKFVLERIK